MSILTTTPIACLLSDVAQTEANTILNNNRLNAELWNFADCCRHDWDAVKIADNIIAVTKDVLLNGGNDESHARIMRIVRSYANVLLLASGNEPDSYLFHEEEDQHYFQTGEIADIDEIIAQQHTVRLIARANMEEVCHG